ncbi:MAG TPA: hypothetical protein VHY20_01725, partial [Pirellulales bacterium]|nr:hypothetical protein [Pirellulales bacterium]
MARDALRTLGRGVAPLASLGRLPGALRALAARFTGGTWGVRRRMARGFARHAFVYSAIALILVGTAPSGAMAGNLLYWDPSTTAGAGLGGAGTWNTTSSQWWDGSSPSDTKWTDFSNAIFTGTPGTVSLGGVTLNVGGLQFDANNYVIGGTPGNSTLNFGGTTTATILMDNATNVTINTNLAGTSSSSLTFGGSGTNIPSINGFVVPSTITLNGGGTSLLGGVTIGGNTTVTLNSTSGSGNAFSNISATAGLTLNSGTLNIVNAAADGAIVHVNAGAPIFSNGGTLGYSNTTAGATYSMSLGAMNLLSGNTTINTANLATGSQTLTLASLAQSGTGTFFLNAAGGANTSTNITVVTGATPSTFLGPWATVTTATAGTLDFATYNASNQIVGEGAVGTAPGAGTNPTTNYQVSATGASALTLTANDSVNTIKYVGSAAGTFKATAGTLQVNGLLNASSGAGFVLTVTAPVTNATGAAGNLYLNGGALATQGITISGAISDPVAGGGSPLKVVVSGAGPTILSGANTFTGGVVLDGGNISIGNTYTTVLGASPGGLTVNSPSTLTFTNANGGANNFTAARTIQINNNATLNFSIASVAETIASLITGTGGLLVTGASSGLTLSNANNNFSGGLNVQGGEVIATAIGAQGPGPIVLGATSGSAAATLLFNITNDPVSNPINLLSNGTLTIGDSGNDTLTITSNITGNNNLTISTGGTNKVATFSGASINNVGTITNVGTGAGGVVI